MEGPRPRRVQRSRWSSVLSSLAEKLWKTEATCAVMIVACSLGENAEIQQGFRELKQVCVDPRGTVMGTCKAHRPLTLQQTPAEGSRGQRPLTRPNLSRGPSCSPRHAKLCGFGHLVARGGENDPLPLQREPGLVILA